jgi:hypothetical protein
MTPVDERELATSLRIAQFRGDMNDEDFTRLVKNVVRILYNAGVEVPVRRDFTHFPPLAIAPWEPAPAF